MRRLLKRIDNVSLRESDCLPASGTGRMTRTNAYRRIKAVMLLTLAAGGLACTDEPTGPRLPPPAVQLNPSQGDRALPAFPELVEFVKPVDLDIAQNPLAPELGDDQLIEAVGAAGGEVHIGLKPADAPRTRQTGIVPGMHRADVLTARDQLRAAGAEIIQTFRNSASLVARISPELAPVLRGLPVVDYLEPTGKFVPVQSVQDTSWGVKKVRADWVWQQWFVAGRRSNITILDTGADPTHRFEWNGDGPANLFTDCYFAASFSSCDDDWGHGSHVAGIAAAWNNDFGYIGVAWDPAGTTMVKVCGLVEGCPTSAIAGGLDHTVSNGRARQVVNMSLGSIYNFVAIAEQVARSADVGNLLIAAAGNNPNQWGSTGVFYPAKYSQVVAVSGTLPDDSFAWPIQCPEQIYTGGSNYGPEVEISAPFYARSMWLNGTYQNHCGTSMAAPVVAGVAALVWTRFPTWSAASVRSRLTSTAIDLGTYGRDSYFGYGRVDAALAAATLPSSHWATIYGPTDVQPYANCQYTADTNVPNPVSYVWEVNGVVQPDNSPSIYVSHGGPSFTLVVTVSNGAGDAAMDDHQVSVNSSAPQCTDQ